MSDTAPPVAGASAYQTDALIASDIGAYLTQHQNKTLLRFITCGSVDDGKSTLIGRLLYDSKMIFEDQLAALEADSKRVGTQGGEIDFAGLGRLCAFHEAVLAELLQTAIDRGFGGHRVSHNALLTCCRRLCPICLDTV